MCYCHLRSKHNGRKILTIHSVLHCHIMTEHVGKLCAHNTRTQGIKQNTSKFTINGQLPTKKKGDEMCHSLTSQMIISAYNCKAAYIPPAVCSTFLVVDEISEIDNSNEHLLVEMPPFLLQNFNIHKVTKLAAHAGLMSQRNYPRFLIPTSYARSNSYWQHFPFFLDVGFRMLTVSWTACLSLVSCFALSTCLVIAINIYKQEIHTRINHLFQKDEETHTQTKTKNKPLPH